MNIGSNYCVVKAHSTCWEVQGRNTWWTLFRKKKKETQACEIPLVISSVFSAHATVSMQKSYFLNTFPSVTFMSYLLEWLWKIIFCEIAAQVIGV